MPQRIIKKRSVEIHEKAQRKPKVRNVQQLVTLKESYDQSFCKDSNFSHSERSHSLPFAYRSNVSSALLFTKSLLKRRRYSQSSEETSLKIRWAEMPSVMSKLLFTSPRKTGLRACKRQRLDSPPVAVPPSPKKVSCFKPRTTMRNLAYTVQTT